MSLYNIWYLRGRQVCLMFWLIVSAECCIICLVDWRNQRTVTWSSRKRWGYWSENVSPWNSGTRRSLTAGSQKGRYPLPSSSHCPLYSSTLWKFIEASYQNMLFFFFCRRETSGLLRGAPGYHRSNSQSTTKEILELKDHLVQVERTVSR